VVKIAIALATSRQALADAYKVLGTWIGTTTGAPGTSATPANESTGGSPAYARKQTTWTSSTGGVVNGTAVTVDLPASTITHMILASAVSGANQVDNSDITDVVFSAQGQAVITPTFTQT
jgi:hypothetical protein